ncbi:MAG: hypothetical protein ABJ059_18815, partial [Hyphomicrobiales bacterium]
MLLSSRDLLVAAHGKWHQRQSSPDVSGVPDIIMRVHAALASGSHAKLTLPPRGARQLLLEHLYATDMKA